MPYGCEITVIAQEGLKTNVLLCYIGLIKVIAQELLITSMLVQEGLGYTGHAQ